MDVGIRRTHMWKAVLGTHDGENTHDLDALHARKNNFAVAQQQVSNDKNVGGYRHAGRAFA